ncbi:MAG: alpha-N-arabinofuranosidase [Pseudomonadales bacterium]
MNTATVSIDTNNSGPQINKNVYGQFAEHLGRVLYDGMWVGPESTIPNTRGWRNDVLEALRMLQVPVLRWPGGCFSDEYRWRDGIGPKEIRPVRVNTLWGGVEENNHVGTHEFFDLVEMLGAEAYINCNMGTGTPREMAEWLEYMTSETRSELAELRRKNGRDEPFRVHHFGIGNETWGAGGFMEPDYYCNRYKHWSSMARVPWHIPTNFVASGGHGAVEEDVTRWTEHLSANIKPNFLLKFDAVSFHYYTHPIDNENHLNFENIGETIDFPEVEWISTLSHTLRMDGFLKRNCEILDKNDPDNHVALYVDEWGTWYSMPQENSNGMLYQQNTLRDALVAALNFHTFHDYSERVRMANIAQIANVLQSMILTDGDKMLVTPSYHAFQLYAPFQNATRLTATLVNVENYSLDSFSLSTLYVTAARGVDDNIYLGIINTNPNQAYPLSIQLNDKPAASLEGRQLTADTMDAHNTFEQPETISPKAIAAQSIEAKLEINIPAKSISVLRIN